MLVPLVAMQFTQEVKWTLSDFVFMGTLLFGTGMAYLLLINRSGNAAYRLGSGVALAAGLLVVWVNAAVGFIGSGPNPANVLCAAVPIVAVAGALLGRLRASGMARAMLAAALTQAAVPLLALLTTEPRIELKSVEVLATAFFVGLWLLAAWLFRRVSFGHSR
ncbi:hypothetical protein BEN48_05830 [Hymenobacter glacialis]|uniref:Uncharacterized protein n=1 Tax=Hymenobacter glacialis TaxID=1908236 RepID=A0A1G1ST86_9BACT|nr:hypothetical protein BEN48_05830 [Hymenobacter glacialis]